MPMILALDSGTTSCRTLAFDAAGSCVAVAQEAFAQHYPQPGWVEHDPEEIWSAQKATLDAVVQQVGKNAIQAIGITNQRETVVAWDRQTGQPLTPAIVWQCRRTTDLCQQLREQGEEERVRARTGLVLDPYFSSTKLAWLLEHTPGLRAKAERGDACFGTVDTWLLWKLTHGRAFATDPSNASRTLLYNLHTGTWDDDLLALFGVPRAALPTIQPSGSGFGTWEGIPIAGILGDQQAALYGQACVTPGSAKCTYGTGCFLLKHAGATVPTPPDGMLATVAGGFAQGRTYAIEGSVFIAGAAVQWLRDGLGLIASADETEALARSVPDTGGVVFVPAFTGLGTPYWNPEARGLLCGLTRGTTKAHLVRATLEAIAHQNADVLEAMGGDGDALRVDGGAAKNDFLMQLQADLLGIPVERPVQTETTALGAALLAAQTVGAWDTIPWRCERRFEPTLAPEQRQQQRAAWRTAVQRAL